LTFHHDRVKAPYRRRPGPVFSAKVMPDPASFPAQRPRRARLIVTAGLTGRFGRVYDRKPNDAKGGA
jgi:hypothetical protein